MNIVLFSEHELGRNLTRRDERTIHLVKVLHKKPGDYFEAGILGGNRGTGKIEKINFDGSIFVSLTVDDPPPEKLKIRAGFALVRQIQIRRILKDLTNIGISHIDIFGTDMGEKSYKDTKLFTDGGAQEAIIEGLSQARDSILPELSIYENIDEWLAKKPWQESTSNKSPFLCVLDNIRPEGSFFNTTSINRNCVFAVGPERGFTDRERKLFEQAGFLRLSMGNRALRTELACTAAAVLAMEKMHGLI